MGEGRKEGRKEDAGNVLLCRMNENVTMISILPRLFQNPMHNNSSSNNNSSNNNARPSERSPKAR
jgi:hypothetical protein